MAEKTRKKPAEAPEKPLEAVPRKSGEPEFTRVSELRDPWEGEAEKKPELAMLNDLKDPWEGEKQLEMPEKGEKLPDLGKGLVAKREILTNEDIAAKLRDLRERAGEVFKYHRGDVSLRPHKTEEPPPTYLDRMSRFGSVAGNRPKAKKKEGET